LPASPNSAMSAYHGEGLDTAEAVVFPGGQPPWCRLVPGSSSCSMPLLKRRRSYLSGARYTALRPGSGAVQRADDPGTVQATDRVSRTVHPDTALLSVVHGAHVELLPRAEAVRVTLLDVDLAAIPPLRRGQRKRRPANAGRRSRSTGSQPLVVPLMYALALDQTLWPIDFPSNRAS
jgi:hypothetical protein